MPKKNTKVPFVNKNEIAIEVVELQPTSYHLFVKVKVNNKVARMLVDTGASKTVLDKNFVVEKFKNSAISSSDNPTSSLHATVQNSESLVVKKMQLGDTILQNYFTTILDLTHVNQTYKSVHCKPIQGILGSDILLEKKAVIDYGKKRIRLNK